jgi:hypothetical protein
MPLPLHLRRKELQQTLDRKLGGPQIPTGRSGEEKHFSPIGIVTALCSPWPKYRLSYFDLPEIQRTTQNQLLGRDFTMPYFLICFTCIVTNLLPSALLPKIRAIQQMLRKLQHKVPGRNDRLLSSERTWNALNTALPINLYNRASVTRRDLQTPRVETEIRRYSSRYSARLSSLPKSLVVNFMEQPDNRRLRRRLLNDLPTRFLV